MRVALPGRTHRLAGLMCSGPVFVTEQAGEEAVRAATVAFLQPFRTDDGGFEI